MKPPFSAVRLDLPQLIGAVGPVVYALNKLLSSLVVRYRFGDITILDSRAEAGSCLRMSSRSSIMTRISAENCCVYSLRRPVGI